MKFYNISKLNVKVGDKVYYPYFDKQYTIIVANTRYVATIQGSYNLFGIDTFNFFVSNATEIVCSIITKNIFRIYEIP